MNTLAATLPANVARTNFYQMLDEVGEYFRRFIITHRGKARAVVMPLDEVEGWEETMEIISNKKLMSDLRQAEKDRQAGRVYPLEQVIKELGLEV